MKRWAMFVGLMFVAGCGSQGARTVPAQRDLLIGNWLLTESTTAGVGLTFTEAGGYTFAALRLEATGQNDLQLENGHYTEFPGSITFDPAQSSCPGAHPSWQAGYTVTDQSLSISDASGALLFVPNPYAPGAGVVTYGCFGSDGTFAPSPLAPI